MCTVMSSEKKNNKLDKSEKKRMQMIKNCSLLLVQREDLDRDRLRDEQQRVEPRKNNRNDSFLIDDRSQLTSSGSIVGDDSRGAGGRTGGRG